MEQITATPRHLSAIAFDIQRNWLNPYFGARPYLDAMRDLDKITDNYHQDSGRSIVAYFLANATSWRGLAARRIKAELKAMLKG